MSTELPEQVVFLEASKVTPPAAMPASNEESYWLLVEGVAEYAIFTLDRANRIVTWNRGAQRLFGYAAVEALGQAGSLIFTTEERRAGAPEQEIATALHTGKAADERWHVRKDGLRFWASSVLTPLLAADGTLHGFAKILRDNTERLHAEAVLREREAQFHQVWEITSDALALSDGAGIVVAANPAYLRLFGYPPEQVIGQGFALIFPEEQQAAALAQYQAVFASADLPPAFEAVVRRADGTERIVEACATFFTAGGRRTAMLSTIRDITERKRAEAALRQTQARLTLAMEAAQMGTWDLDLTTNHTQTNLRHNQIFGYREAVAEWNPDIFRAHILPEERDKLAASFAQALVSGEFDLEARVRWPDDSVHWIYDRGRVYYDAKGMPARIVGMTQDITARKETEEALRQLNESLEVQVAERTGQVRELVVQVALSEQAERHRISQILHDDLQQRLYGLQFQLKLLGNELKRQAEEQVQPTRAEIAAVVTDSIQLIRSLSVDLSPPVLEGEGLVDALGWLANQMEQLHSLQVRVQAEADLPIPHTDLRVLLFQAVRELLFNIAKHARVARAVVALSYDTDQIRIEVTDHGQGFDIEAVLGENRRSHGLGQTQRRLELVGGHMQVHSSPQDGTRIVLTCPLPREAG